MAYIARENAGEGTALEIDTGKDAALAGQVCAMPFYKAPKAG